MRSISVDLLGAGDSDKPADARLDPGAQAGAVLELLDALGVDRVAVVGHGHGAVIAGLLAARRSAEALVLIDAVARGEPAPEMRQLLDAAAANEVSVDEVLSSAFARGMRRPIDAAALAEYRRPFAEPGGREALARLAAALVEPSGLGLDELGALDVPVLLACGEDDGLVPPGTAERLNDAMPRSALALLPGCGHFLPEEAPRTLAPLLYEYLRGTYAHLPHVHETGPTTIELGRRYTKE
jgi:pimeloyl-ACP methyl ester carboxylesterase